MQLDVKNYFQFIEPSFHSNNTPKIRIDNNIKFLLIKVDVWIIFTDRGIGRSIEISMSKIKNIRATEKNWIENEFRDLLILSNPHSKGDIFSRFNFLCVLIMGSKIVDINNKITIIMTKYFVSILIILSIIDYLVGS